MNISFMQNGGGMPPFTYYQPVLINNTSPERYNGSNKTDSAKTTTSKKSDDKEDGFGKIAKLVNALKGLPSDLDLIQNQVSTLLQLAQYGASPGELDAMYAKTAFEIKKAQFSQTKYENVEEYARKVDSLTEMAITPEGGLLVKDVTKKNPEIETVSISKYLQNRNKYVNVTNQELLELRAKKSPKNDKLLDVVNNGTSLIAIDKLLNQYIDQIGTNFYEGTGTSRTQQGKIIQGIEFIQDAINRATIAGIPIDGNGLVIDGLYEAKLITKEQKLQAIQSLEYLKKMLPKNMKTYLLASTGSEKGVLSILENFIYRKTNTEVHFNSTLQDLKQNEGSSNKTDTNKSDELDNNTDVYQNIIRGTGGTNTTFTLKDKDGHVYQTNAIAYPQFTPDEIAPRGSLSLLLNSTNLKGITKGSNYAITFGSQILDPYDLTSVAYIDDANATRVMLPIKYDQGKIVPDLEFVKNNQDIINALNSQNSKDPELIKKLQNVGLIDPFTGLPDMNKFQVYLCINGLATNQTIDNTNYVQEVSKDQHDNYLSLFMNAVKGDKNNNAHADAKEFKYDDFEWWNPFDYFGTDKLYKGTIFLPITENVLQGALSAKSTIKNDDAHELQTDYAQGQIARNMNPTSSNVLGL